MAELLRLDGVTAGYGDATVIDGITLSVETGGSLALLGRNGVGKSTLLATLMGITRRSSGAILWRGAEITNLPTHQRARLGLGWVPQERDIFSSLSVAENLSAVARPGPWTIDRVYGLFPRLAERRSNMGNQLSGGEQQMLAIGRALVLNPQLLLLDEPFEGLAPLLVQELTSALRTLIADTHIALILVEQHVKQALALTQQALILDRGRVVHRVASEQLAGDRAALERWLGIAG
jgi:branched-chain amino acid transport system ATP-binding protein